MDGTDALRRLSDEAVDFVITGINMPNMNGFELIHKIRTTEHIKFLPVIVIFTETDRDAPLLGKTAGAAAWIHKPFSESKVVSTLGKCY